MVGLAGLGLIVEVEQRLLQLRVNEFYKKGCQEKTPPRPEWRVFLEIQPTVVSLLWRGLAGCPFS